MSKEEQLEVLHNFIMSPEGHERFTQDSPILPDVWLEFAKSEEKVDLILTPWEGSSPADFKNAFSFLKQHDAVDELAQNNREIAVKLSLTQLIEYYLPLTYWWRAEFEAGIEDEIIQRHITKVIALTMGVAQENKEAIDFLKKYQSDSGYSARVASFEDEPFLREILQSAASSLLRAFEYSREHDFKSAKLWNISLNRPSFVTQNTSHKTVKADAAWRVFRINADDITWAVIDSGIDGTHSCFTKYPWETDRTGIENSRVIATYDFTRLRRLIFNQEVDQASDIEEKLADAGYLMSDLKNIGDLKRNFDWGIFEPILRISHKDEDYQNYLPKIDHGTHVAGILGGCAVPPSTTRSDREFVGIAPNIRLMDIRVFDDMGHSDEFTINAALQFISWLNRDRERLRVHGVNLSLSLAHSVKNFACGQTPICLEVKRLADSGVVVVAAAGNNGYQQFQTSRGRMDGYLSTSITDPGNSEDVITVGSTHRERPHSYGVSYFSSRGPTGDGRMKPDILAPGERIEAPVLNDELGIKDGTSMAAPHVSGAAALLMARHDELKGNPRKIKKILMDTATDLGRERYFQGAGLLDILRAMESV